MNRTDWTESGLELLVFELADVRLGLELSVVREVVRAVFIMPLPEAPPVIEGIIDLRGHIVPVYDLRRRFGLSPSPVHPDQRIVIAWTGDRLVALRCDRTGWIEAVPGSAVDSSGPLVEGNRRVAGVARLPDGIVLIQDLATFLDDAERAGLDDALAGRAARDAD